MDQSVAIQETLLDGATCRIISFAPCASREGLASSLFFSSLSDPSTPISVCRSLTHAARRARSRGCGAECGEPAAGPGGARRAARVGAEMGQSGLVLGEGEGFVWGGICPDRGHSLRLCSVFAGSTFTPTGGWPSLRRTCGWRGLSPSQRGLQWKKVFTRFGAQWPPPEEGMEGCGVCISLFTCCALGSTQPITFSHQFVILGEADASYGPAEGLCFINPAIQSSILGSCRAALPTPVPSGSR